MDEQRDLFDCGDRPPPKLTRRTCTPADPGTGPGGKYCASCEHFAAARRGTKWVRKCQRMRRYWSESRRTEIRGSWPACRDYQERGG